MGIRAVDTAYEKYLTAFRKFRDFCGYCEYVGMWDDSTHFFGSQYCLCGFIFDHISIVNMTQSNLYPFIEILFIPYTFLLYYMINSLEKLNSHLTNYHGTSTDASGSKLKSIIFSCLYLFFCFFTMCFNFLLYFN